MDRAEWIIGVGFLIVVAIVSVLTWSHWRKPPPRDWPRDRVDD